MTGYCFGFYISCKVVKSLIMQVVVSIIHLIFGSARLAISWMGTTTLAVLVLVAPFLARLFVSFRKGGWPSVKNDLKEAFGYTVAVWIILFVIGMGRFVYQDHHSLLARISQLNAANKSLHGSLENKIESPVFKLDLETAWTASRDGWLVVIVDGLLTNSNGPESGVTNWRMVLGQRGSTVQGFILPPMAPDSHGVEGRVNLKTPRGTKVFLSSEYWPKNSVTPIRAGAGLPGWVWFIFPKLTKKEFEKRGIAELVLSVDDLIGGRTHHAKMVVNDPRWTDPVTGEMPNKISKRP